MTTQYKYETYGTTMVFSEDDITDAQLDEIGKRFTQSLAASMMNTKETIMANIMNTAWDEVEKPYETEVKFDGQE